MRYQFAEAPDGARRIVAEDTWLARKVLIKVLASQRALHGIRIQAGLVHPQVPPVLDLLDRVFGRRWAVVQALHPGRTAAELLRQRGPLRPDRARWVVGSVARALADLHQREVLHLALSPDHVLLQQRGGSGATLLGWSRARRVDDVEPPGPARPCSAAPEQLSGGALTPATDCYQLALLWHALLEGRDFFPATPAGEDARTFHQAQRLAPPEELPSGLRAAELSLWQRCLSVDPAERPADGAAFLAALA